MSFIPLQFFYHFFLYSFQTCKIVASQFLRKLGRTHLPSPLCLTQEHLFSFAHLHFSRGLKLSPWSFSKLERKKETILLFLIWRKLNTFSHLTASGKIIKASDAARVGASRLGASPTDPKGLGKNLNHSSSSNLVPLIGAYFNPCTSPRGPSSLCWHTSSSLKNIKN